MSMMELLDADTKRLLATIKSLGYSVHLVGGCVRDFMMGEKEFKDIDVAINCEDMPGLMVKLQADGFKIVDTGLKFGIFTVFFPSGLEVDVAQYRAETYKYGDRHPEVRHVKTIHEDLGRRDFGRNAMALEYTGDQSDFVLVDPHGGKTDIEGNVIKAVGDPEARFLEDPLRMMRAARFKSRFSATYDPKTLEVMQRLNASDSA